MTRPQGQSNQSYRPTVTLVRTARVALRRWVQADAGAFLSLYGREDVSRWLGPHPRRPVADLAEAKQRIRRWNEYQDGLPRPFGFWAIVETGDSDAPIGTVLLLPLQDARGDTGEVEIGWHLHPDRQGQGFVTEAAQAVLAAAADAGLARVLALTDADNTASQAVARRLGMVFEGSTDRWFDLVALQYRKDLQAGPAVVTTGST